MCRMYPETFAWTSMTWNGWNCPARLSVWTILPRFTGATVADGISAASACVFLPPELQAITRMRTGNARPKARIKEIRLRISAMHLFDGWIAGRSQDGLPVRRDATGNPAFGLN